MAALSSFSKLLRAVGFGQKYLPSTQEVANAPEAALARFGWLHLAYPTTVSPVVLITGRAGTGKSTLIRHLTREPNSRTILLAPTGIAALNVKGQTIHSFFGFPPRIIDPTEIEPASGKSMIMRKIDRIIIDEASMVRADLLDAVDVSLRKHRSDTRPFGGVELVLVGDFLQLPPVTPDDDLAILREMGYESPYLLSAKSLQNLTPKMIRLERVWRQSEPEFLELLAKARSGSDSHLTAAAFNGRCHREHRGHKSPLLLTPKRRDADDLNERMLKRLSGNSSVFHASLSGDFELDEKHHPAPACLELRLGARVVMLRNDPGKRWVNGSLGTISKIGNSSIWTEIDGQTTAVEVFREKWEKYRYRFDRATETVVSVTTGEFIQFPMRLAWAMTIHKAQGLTLTDVRIDIRSGTFASGQAYVALSRARTLDGLSLCSPLTAADLRVHQSLVAIDDEIKLRSTTLQMPEIADA